MSELKEGKVMQEEIAKKIKELGELELDVLRIIEVYGGVLWKSEVQPSLKKFYDELGKDTPIESKDLKVALKNLEKSKLISIEQRTRGSLDSVGTHKDGYIFVSNPEPTKLALLPDRTLMKYKVAVGRELARRPDEFSS